jgi:hypothetical protein
MPRTVLPHSLLAPLHRKATKALRSLHQEITRREQELADLKAEVARWKQVVSEQDGKSHFRTPPLGVSAASRSHVNWTAMLKQLPVHFTPRDITAERTSGNGTGTEVGCAVSIPPSTEASNYAHYTPLAGVERRKRAALVF